jgi:hypothetical protein
MQECHIDDPQSYLIPLGQHAGISNMQVGQHARITTAQAASHRKSGVGQYAGMMGQHKQEWSVNMVGNLQFNL